VGVLVATLVVLLAMLFSPYILAAGGKTEVVDGILCLAITALLLMYTLLVFGLRFERYRKIAQWGLLLVVCVELASFSWQTVNDRSVVTAEELESKVGYNDYTHEAIAAIRLKDSGFYRIGKTYSSGLAMHASLNDAKLQGYYGVDSYHSFNQVNYVRFLDAVDIIGDTESATRWARGLVDNPILASFSAIKYILVKNELHVQKLARVGYKLVHKEGDVLIFQNPYYLPFGFTYDSYLSEEEFMSLPTLNRRIALMKTGVMKLDGEADLSQLMTFGPERLSSAYNLAAYIGDVKQRRFDGFSINHFGHNLVKGEVTIDKPRILFFTLPFDLGWVATVNGNPVELHQVNVGFSGLLLPEGKHVVELRYHLPGFMVSLIISVLSIVAIMFFLWRLPDGRLPGSSPVPVTYGASDIEMLSVEMKISYGRKTLLFIVFFIGILVFTYQALEMRTDILLHAEFLSAFVNESFFMPNPLYYVAVGLVAFWQSEMRGLLVASAVVLSLALVAKYYLTTEVIAKWLDVKPQKNAIAYKWILLSCFSLLFIFCLPLPGFNWYIGQFPPNIWHNSTSIMLVPFAIALFYYSSCFLDKPDGKLLKPIAILVVLNLLIKPSFFFVFAPVFSLLCLYWYGLSRHTVYAGLTVLLGTCIMSIQYYGLYYYHDPIYDELTLGSDASVKVGWLHVWSDFSPNIILSIVNSLLIPIVFLIGYPSTIKSDRRIQYALCLLVTGLLIFAIFYETGGREFHGNFFWQAIIANFMLHLVVLTAFLKLKIKNPQFSKYDYFLVTIFILEFIVGILYMLKLPFYSFY